MTRNFVALCAAKFRVMLKTCMKMNTIFVALRVCPAVNFVLLGSPGGYTYIFLPQSGLPWGSYSLEERSVAEGRGTGSPATLGPVPPDPVPSSPTRIVQKLPWRPGVVKNCVGDLSCQQTLEFSKKMPWRSELYIQNIDIDIDIEY